MNTNIYKGTAFAALFIIGTATLGFSQAQQAQTRIPQQVVINGQNVNGAYVQVPGGGLQSFTCSNPQHYATPDGATNGWACFDAATNTWLLNAVPPVSAQAAPVPVPSQPPAVIYQQPPAIVYQPPAVVYQQPAVVYATPSYPVFVGGVYSPGAVIGAAAINATGRIVSAALLSNRYYGGRAFYPARVYAPVRVYQPVRVYRPGRGHRR